MAWDCFPTAESFLKKGAEKAIMKFASEINKMYLSEAIIDSGKIAWLIREMCKKYPNVEFGLKLVTRYDMPCLKDMTAKPEVVFSVLDPARSKVSASIVVTKYIKIKPERAGGYHNAIS